jgi:hypothetical protein
VANITLHLRSPTLRLHEEEHPAPRLSAPHVDVRKALRHLAPFLDEKWELVNGFPGRMDPHSPFSDGPDIVPTRDGKWIMLADGFPLYAARTRSP